MPIHRDAHCENLASQRTLTGWAVRASETEVEIVVNPGLAAILVQAGASIAFAVHADGGRLPPAGHAVPSAAVERGAQTATGRPAGSALAEGQVRWVDPVAGKLTVMHGQHLSLRMPPMTMVVRVKDRGRLDQLRPGDKILFSAERINGLLTATVLQSVK